MPKQTTISFPFGGLIAGYLDEESGTLRAERSEWAAKDYLRRSRLRKRNVGLWCEIVCAGALAAALVAIWIYLV